MSEYSPKFLSAAHARKKEAEVAARATKAPDLTCFVDQFPLAMAAVAAVHDYKRGPLVKGDYLPSLLRHLFKHGEHPDHDAAVAWNALARLEMRERAAREKPRNTLYNRPSEWHCPEHPTSTWRDVAGHLSCAECERKP